jgi:hypothetical protein
MVPSLLLFCGSFDALAAKLIEILWRFKVLREEVSARPGGDAKVAALEAVAQKTIKGMISRRRTPCWQTCRGLKSTQVHSTR